MSLIEIYYYSVAFDKAELYSASWEEGLRFERPATPDTLYYDHP